MTYARLFLTLLVISLVAACASQRTDKAIAYRNFEVGDYAETVEWIRRVESRGNVPPETKAELTYLEARSLEEMGEYDSSQDLYSYLIEQHPTSKFAYRSRSKLGEEIE